MADPKVEAAQGRLRERGNGVGKFNIAGQTLGGGDKEFSRRGDSWYVRNRSQTTKDRATVEQGGGDANATKAPKAASEAKLAATHKGTMTMAKPTMESSETWQAMGGTVENTGKALAAERTESAEASLGKDGFKVEVGAGVKASLYEGKLVYKAPAAQFTMLQEAMQAEVGVELSTEAAATLEGKVELAAKGGNKGVELGFKGGLNAFAGVKSGVKLFGKLQWKPKGAAAYVDIAEASAGAEGYLGAAAACEFQVALMPRIRANYYWGGAVGVGAAVKNSVEIGAIEAAKLAAILIPRGAERALDGLEEYGPLVIDWLRNQGGKAYAASGLEETVQVLDDWLSDDDKAREVLPEVYMHMTPKGRAMLIDRMMAGSCTDADEDAIVRVIRSSGAKGDLGAVLSAVDGGTEQVLWKLDGLQDGQARALLARYGSR